MPRIAHTRGYRQAPGFNPHYLKEYMATLGVTYFFESQPVLRAAETCMEVRAGSARAWGYAGTLSVLMFICLIHISLCSHEMCPHARWYAHAQNDSICSWCARMKRGILYSTCRREGYNVLALAQHLDDLVRHSRMHILFV